MKNADLAEVRALLRAAVVTERRPSGPFSVLLGLWPAAPARPAAPASKLPPPRRVGLARPEAAVDAAAAAPLDGEAVAYERREAFGRRREVGTVSMLRLTAPDASSALAAGEPEAAPPRPRPILHAVEVEAPFLPEDLADQGEAEAERIYRAAGLFEAGLADLPRAGEPVHEMLEHLGRVFLAERAALLGGDD